MTRRDWEQGGCAAARRLPERRGARRRETRRASPIVDDSFLILFNAHHESVDFTLPPRRFGAHWTLELSTADPDASPQHASTRAASVDARVAVARRAAARVVTELRATYRLQLGPTLTLADARASSSRTCASSASATSTSRPSCRRGAARRTATTWSTRRRVSRRARRRDRVCARSARPASGSILDVVPNHMAAEPTRTRSGATRSCADVLRPRSRRPAGTAASSTSTSSPASASRIPRSSRRRTASCSSSSREGLVDGLRIDHPDGLADPRGYLERLRAAGVERIWVEKILEPGEPLRDWPVEGTTGYEFANDVQALFVDPAGEATLTELSGEPRAVGRGRLRGEARAGGDDVRARGRAAAAAARRAGPRARARLAAGLPHLRRAGSGRVEEADREALAALPRRAAPRPAARGARPRRVRHALPADDAAR